jgi:molybdopterin converting factor small subunit
VGVKVNIHKTHRELANGLDIVEVEGQNVGDCLSQLIGQFPGFQEVLFAKSGKLQNWIEIYVNMESAYPEELAKPVKDGDEMHITIMLSGG